MDSIVSKLRRQYKRISNILEEDKTPTQRFTELFRYYDEIDPVLFERLSGLDLDDYILENYGDLLDYDDYPDNMALLHKYPPPEPLYSQLHEMLIERIIYEIETYLSFDLTENEINELFSLYTLLKQEGVFVDQRLGVRLYNRLLKLFSRYGLLI